jgi:hypothetical protein
MGPLDFTETGVLVDRELNNRMSARSGNYHFRERTRDLCGDFYRIQESCKTQRAETKAGTPW